MKLGDIMLSDKTKVGLNLATLATVIIFVITIASGWGSLKATMEKDIQGLKKDVESNSEDIEIMQPVIVQMSTDIGWMRDWMENKDK